MSVPIEDTICAIATPVGEGGIGILRVSGEKALHIASKVVQLRSAQSLHAVRSHHLYQADILDPGRETETPLGTLDEALVVVMRSPHSYTGEHVVELHCHGGPYLLHAVCDGLLRAGARLAEPGEFTKRAFLNGRLDLTQAEAVLDTIRAKTTAGLRLAQGQMRGVLSRQLERMQERLIQALAHVEAGIDFTEEDISFISNEALASNIRETLTDIAKLLDSFHEGQVLREGISAAIIGRPNVGKSSLLNALLRSDRAIVTPVPGTTRDVLEELINIRGIAVRLLDTAGLRDTEDLAEQEGVRRSRFAMEECDLLLIVFDGSSPLSNEDRELVAQYPQKKQIWIINKSDLPSRIHLVDAMDVMHGGVEPAILHVSAKTGQGLDELRDGIRRLVLRGGVESGDSPVITRLRHQKILEQAGESLRNARASVEAGLSAEFVAMDLRAAINALGEMTGRISTDDILERIFRDFCIGK
jgi:tRNA modification GTPase